MTDESDVEDDGKSRRHVMLRHESSGATAPLSPTSQSNAHAVVQQFIKDVQPRHIRSRQKEHITAFAKWYFQKKPNLSDADIAYLMLGDGDRKGLLESCGNSNLKRIGDIKNSAVMALELVVLLLDATINIHSDRFLDFLPRIPLKIVQGMKLERHILSDQNAPDNAFKLLFLLAEQLPNYKLSEFVDGNSEALERYNDWLDEHMDEKDALDGDEDAGAPRTWAQVKLDDCDKEEGALLGMEADLESVMEAALASGDEETETLDPLGLTRITLDARGHMLVGGKKGAAHSAKGASSGKKIKLFWKKLLKAKEKEQSEALQKNKKGTAGKDSVAAGAALLGAHSRPLTLDEEDEDGVGGLGGLHLVDAIMQRGSINTAMHDFNPVLFLSTVHSNTSLADLERGLNTLQQSVNSRTTQMKKLVEQHFGQYVYCKDTIDHLHSLLQSEITSNNKVASSSGRSVRLLRDIESVRAECEALYAPLLARKTESDQIRSVLGILGRFKFLFSLPGKLHESRKKRAWEQVIRDYQKAKQLVVLKAAPSAAASAAAATPSAAGLSVPAGAGGGSAAPSPSAAAIAASAANIGAGVTLLSLTNPSALSATAAAAAAGSLGIPESVLFEIGRLMLDIRRELFRSLDQPHVPLEEQQKVIGYLVALDCEEDPAWYYLKKQREWIGSCLEKAMEEHCTRLEQSLFNSSVLKSFVASAAATGGAAATSPLRLLSGSIPFHLLCIQNPDCVASLQKLVRKLCAVVSRCMPDFFELATAIQAGKFGVFRGAPGGSVPTNTTAAVAAEEKEAAPTPSPSHRGSIYDSSAAGLTTSPPPPPLGSPSGAAASGSANAAGATAAAAAAAGSSSPAPAVPADPPSVGRLVASINQQFANYIRLALFPPTAAQLARNPAAAAAAASASPTGADLGFDGVPTASALNSTSSGGSSGSGLSADQFPPQMFQHVNDVLSCVDLVRGLPTMPLTYVSELRLLSDQLTQLYLDHHVRELLLYVAAMHKDEQWELDPQIGIENDIVALFGAAGAAALGIHPNGGGGGSGSSIAADNLFSFAFSSADSTSGLGSAASGMGGGGLGGPSGPGYAGAVASNAPFQVTLLPGHFHAAVSSTLRALEALPSIRSKWVVERIVGAVFEAMKCFADAMHALTMQICAQQNATGYAYDRNYSNMHGGGGGGLPAGLGAGPTSPTSAALSFSSSLHGPSSSSVVSSWVRPNELDRRLLLIWSNLLHVHDSLLSPLLDQLLELLPVSTHAALDAKFDEEVLHLYGEILEESIVLDAYKRSKVLQLNAVVKKGYFKNGINWRSKTAAAAPPSSSAGSSAVTPSSSSSSTSGRLHLSVRSCVLELLLQFVLIHDELYTVRKECVDEVIESLVEKLAYLIMHTVSNIEMLCDVQGANQLLVELEFLQSTLDYYLDDESESVLEQCSAVVLARLESEADAATNSSQQSEAVVERAATERAQVLQQTKQSTAMMFSCFTSTQVRKKKFAATTATAAADK